MTVNRVNQLIRICLDLADSIDEAGMDDEKVQEVNRLTLDSMHLGYRAASRQLREGIKAIIELRGKYYSAIEKAKYAKMSEKAAGEFLEEVFGDSDIDCINDKDKARIKQFVAEIMKE